MVGVEFFDIVGSVVDGDWFVMVEVVVYCGCVVDDVVDFEWDNIFIE